MIVVDCCYVFDRDEKGADFPLSFKIAPDSIAFHLFEAISSAEIGADPGRRDYSQLPDREASPIQMRSSVADSLADPDGMGPEIDESVRKAAIGKPSLGSSSAATGSSISASSRRRSGSSRSKNLFQSSPGACRAACLPARRSRGYRSSRLLLRGYRRASREVGPIQCESERHASREHLSSSVYPRCSQISLADKRLVPKINLQLSIAGLREGFIASLERGVE